ncbi:MAG: hypothetical protein IT343_11140 [Candidatus Melainabacteria bacterium]|nr:hypothetical protein [Candidatus Melainabacteria bacterium]
MREYLVDKTDGYGRLRANRGLAEEYNRFGASVRIQEWIDKYDIFQTHVINAVILERCKNVESPADRDYLRDQEEKNRGNEKGSKFHKLRVSN